MEPDAVEIRVVGCLIEKQRTTPDAYPLSLNALRLACNQSTNRDPVVDYDEATVSEALRRLALRGWTRLASGAGSRARKYRHLLPEALGLDDAEVALLAVLMLRGPQTPGELKQRSERLHGFADLAAVEETLERPGRARPRRPPRAPAGPEGGALRAAARRARRRRRPAPRSPRPSPAPSPPGAVPAMPGRPDEDRLAAWKASSPPCAPSWRACARPWASLRPTPSARASAEADDVDPAAAGDRGDQLRSQLAALAQQQPPAGAERDHGRRASACR